MMAYKKPILSFRYLQSLIGFKEKDLKRIADKVGRYYKPFDSRKIGATKSKWRHIDNPTDTLKKIQSRLQSRLLNKYVFPDTIFGGVRGGSPIKNAKVHVGQAWVVALDLKNCFGRINPRSIYNAYENVFGCCSDIASLLTKLTTFQHRLPQGAPSSSTLANAALLPMHDEIKLICDQFGLRFSFFVDDITFSGNNALKAIETIHKIILKYGHEVNWEKKKIMPRFVSQRVTGPVINHKLSIGRAKKKIIFDRIMEFANKSEITTTEYRSLWGQIAYAKIVCFEQGIVLENRAEKYLPLPTDKQNAERIKIAETRPCKKHSYH